MPLVLGSSIAQCAERPTSWPVRGTSSRNGVRLASSRAGTDPEPGGCHAPSIRPVRCRITHAARRTQRRAAISTTRRCRPPSRTRGGGRARRTHPRREPRPALRDPLRRAPRVHRRADGHPSVAPAPGAYDETGPSAAVAAGGPVPSRGPTGPSRFRSDYAWSPTATPAAALHRSRRLRRPPASPRRPTTAPALRRAAPAADSRARSAGTRPEAPSPASAAPTST